MQTKLVFSTPHGIQKIPIEEIDSIEKEEDAFVNMTVNVKNGKSLLVTNGIIQVQEE